METRKRIIQVEFDANEINMSRNAADRQFICTSALYSIIIGASLSEPHINGISSRNYCIPIVRRTYVVRHSNCKRYVRNSNCKCYGM